MEVSRKMDHLNFFLSTSEKRVRFVEGDLISGTMHSIMVQIEDLWRIRPFAKSCHIVYSWKRLNAS